MALAVPESTDGSPRGETIQKVRVDYVKDRKDSATFTIEEEDHTLGNALQYAVSQSPAVDFAAYSMPHPLARTVHVRIQTRDGSDALDQFVGGLENLRSLFDTVDEKFARGIAARQNIESIDTTDAVEDETS